MQKIIENEDITIRILEESDKSLLLSWLQDKRVLNFWEGQSAIFDLKRIEEDFFSQEDFEMIRVIIEYKNKPIGYAQIYKLTEEMFEEYSYETESKVVYALDQFIGIPEFWGKGIGTSFMKLMLNFLSSKKNAEAVILDPHKDNLRAIRCYEKVGFKIIKELPKHELHDGLLTDCVLMEYKMK